MKTLIRGNLNDLPSVINSASGEKRKKIASKEAVKE